MQNKKAFQKFFKCPKYFFYALYKLTKNIIALFKNKNEKIF
jgi:hypothetical protein